jgi:hypothetical protein
LFSYIQLRKGNCFTETLRKKILHSSLAYVRLYKVIGIFDGVTSSSIIISSRSLPSESLITESPAASIPLSPDIVLAVSMRSCSFADDCVREDEEDEEEGMLAEGLGVSLSNECIDNGDEVIELNFDKIFGVTRPLNVSLCVELSGDGQIGNGDDPRL